METIVLSGVVSGALGILLGSYVSFGWSGVFLSILLASFLFALYGWKRKPIYLYATVVVCSFGIGMFRMELAPTNVPENLYPFIDQEIDVRGKIVADPDVRETTQRIVVEIEQEGQKSRILVVSPIFPTFSYGQEVYVRGVLEYPEPFESDGGRIFEYDRFLAKDGIFVMVSNGSLELVSERKGLDQIYGALTDIKGVGIKSLSNALPEPHASLASGLILGGKQGLGQSLLDDFIRSGLIHIVVLSGYNVMIVAEFILRLFGFLPKRKAALIAGATISLFVLIAGAGAASIRAGIMAAIALYARATGRTYDALRALILAGLVMVLINPLSLAFDPGFQLSFIATLGLIFGAPLVETRLSFIRSDFMREIVSATIAAQVAVLPLLLYQNGLFSVISLPANILVLPIVPIAMIASFIAGLAGFLAPPLAPILGLPAYALLSYIITTVEVASTLPLAAFIVPAFPFAITLLTYIAMAVVLWKFAKLQTPVRVSQLRSS